MYSFAVLIYFLIKKAVHVKSYLFFIEVVVLSACDGGDDLGCK